MHAPSAYRELLRRQKAGHDDPRVLLAEAKRITDPAWQAKALRDLSGDRRLQWQESKQGLRDAVKAAQSIERLGQRGDVWAHLLNGLAEWREGARNPQAPFERRDLLEACLADLEAMPDGEWTLHAIAAVAPVVPAGHDRLMARALANTGFEAAGAKAIVKAHPEAADLLVDAPADVRAFAVEAGALEAAWAIEDPNKRAEALRVQIWKTDDPKRLEIYARSAQGKGPDDQVRLWTQVGARLDKLGLDGAEALWSAAEALLPRCENKKLADKLDQARNHGKKPDGPKPEIRQMNPVEPAKEATGNMLALVNTYQGGLKRPHLLAIARAAPLCHAFGLELGLIDFPGDVDTIVKAVDTETGIGEGGRYLTALQEAGRIHTQPAGTVVATTPKPEPRKEVKLEDGKGALCLLMGVGPQGLPAHMLDRAHHHYEITGAGVSLETATAMGILAERLRAYAATAKPAR